jgi:hypothetical protein
MHQAHIQLDPAHKSKATTQAQRPTFLDKRKKKVKNESKEDRLADVPMFLI